MVECIVIEGDQLDVLVGLGLEVVELDGFVVLFLLVECSVHFVLLFGAFEDVVHRFLVGFHLEVPDLAHGHVLVLLVKSGFFDFLDEHIPMAVCKLCLFQVV